MQHAEGKRHSEGQAHAATHHHYGRLAAMLGLSFVAMYALMYAMVDVAGNVFNSLNQAYMAGLMTAPMAILEIVLMGAMYRDRRKNALIVAAASIAFVGLWCAIRSQAGIGDRQFLRSMIPHHAGAILMCEEAALADPELRALCLGIRRGQQAEIDQMKSLLARTHGQRHAIARE